MVEKPESRPNFFSHSFTLGNNFKYKFLSCTKQLYFLFLILLSFIPLIDINQREIETCTKIIFFFGFVFALVHTYEYVYVQYYIWYTDVCMNIHHLLVILNITWRCTYIIWWWDENCRYAFEQFYRFLRSPCYHQATLLYEN